MDFDTLKSTENLKMFMSVYDLHQISIFLCENVSSFFWNQGNLDRISPSTMSLKYLSWWWPSWEPTGWHPQCNPWQTCVCALPFSLAGSRSGPCWAGGAHAHWTGRPASWGIPACRFLHWCEQHSPGIQKSWNIQKWILQNFSSSILTKQSIAFSNFSILLLISHRMKKKITQHFFDSFLLVLDT